MNEITDETKIVVLRDNIKIYMNESEFNSLKEILTTNPPKFLMLKGRVINVNSIVYAMSAAEYDEREKIKENIRRGMWKCDHGWVSKEFKECSKGCIR